MFFHGVAIKTAVSVSWHTTPVSLYQSNDLQFEIQNKKDAAILKMLLWISCFWFWSYAPSKFCCFDVHCTVTPDISSSCENINSTAHVSGLSFHFLWLWLNTHQLSQKLVGHSCTYQKIYPTTQEKTFIYIHSSKDLESKFIELLIPNKQNYIIGTAYKNPPMHHFKFNELMKNL